MAFIRKTTWFEDSSIDEWTVSRVLAAMGHELSSEHQRAEATSCLKWSGLPPW